MSERITQVGHVAESLAEHAVQRLADVSIWVIFRLNRVES
jgi:hypothetical protein